MSLQKKMSLLKDEDSYRQLFYHFYPILLSFCTTILNNKEDAEEVVSEVLLKVWTMGEELDDIENLTVYLFTADRKFNQQRQARFSQGLLINNTLWQVMNNMEAGMQKMNFSLQKAVAI